MGLAFSCPLDELDDLDNVLERSVSFGRGAVGSVLRSVSFNGRDSEASSVMRSYGSGKMLFEGSLSFKGRELSATFSFKSPISKTEREALSRSGSLRIEVQDVDQPSLQESDSTRHDAAVKLQKVYKSFRTRRQLADCAVLVEQRWWKLLDFAELKQSSISFFDIEKPETAISRWSRAKRRAAKVGKGLSKDDRARKLALQHWLEAIDPRHRYGHNLQFYYLNWLQCDNEQPFFYWLDIGEGKEVNLERCPRSKLQQQCIKYLGPTERKAYEMVVEDGKFIFKQSGKRLDTTDGPKDAKWIFVLSTSKTLYVGQKSKGTFQHSSFLAGGATLSAGRLVAEDGILKAVWPHSGHYLPTEENFEEFMLFLRDHNVDLSSVKKSPSDDDGEEVGEDGIRKNYSEADLSQDPEITNIESMMCGNADSRQQDSNAAEDFDPRPAKTSRLRSKITGLEIQIPARDDMIDIFNSEADRQNCNDKPTSPSDEDYESEEEPFLMEEDFMLTKANLFHDDEDDGEMELIPQEKILKRINSHKGMKSYQLAKQLSSRWTTGAGPRIGCMRDYPTELRSRILEQANLSPRPRSTVASPRTDASRFSPKLLTPNSLCREKTSKSPLATDQLMLSKTATP